MIKFTKDGGTLPGKWNKKGHIVTVKLPKMR